MQPFEDIGLLYRLHYMPQQNDGQEDLIALPVFRRKYCQNFHLAHISRVADFSLAIASRQRNNRIVAVAIAQYLSNWQTSEKASCLYPGQRMPPSPFAGSRQMYLRFPAHVCFFLMQSTVF